MIVAIISSAVKTELSSIIIGNLFKNSVALAIFFLNFSKFSSLCSYVNVINEVAKLTSDVQDSQVGINIIAKALEEPVRQIAVNAGVEGSVIIEKVRNSEPGVGYDALHDEYKNMIKAGIVDPTKVTRSALQNAASVASTFLTTEAAVADIPAKEPAAPGAPGMGMDGMY